MKSIGYVISILSVLLLGLAAWQGVADNETLRLCLIGGMIASVIGMLLRWISHLQDQREKNKLARNG